MFGGDPVRHFANKQPKAVAVQGFHSGGGDFYVAAGAEYTAQGRCVQADTGMLAKIVEQHGDIHR